MQSLHCSNCGERLPTDAYFCPACGSKIVQEYPMHRARNREGRARNEVWGLVSFGGFLIILALTFLAYPDLFARIVDYLRSFGKYGHPVLPPYSLGAPLIYFLNLSGIWGFVLAGVRLALDRSIRGAIEHAISGFFALFLAYALSGYYARAFDGWTLIAFFIMGLAVVIIVNGIVSYVVPALQEKPIAT